MTTPALVLPDRTELGPVVAETKVAAEFARVAKPGKYVEVWIEVSEPEPRGFMIRGRRPNRWVGAELFWSGRIPTDGRVPRPTRADCIAVGVMWGADKVRASFRTALGGPLIGG